MKSARFNNCIKTPTANAGQDVRPASKRPKHASIHLLIRILLILDIQTSVPQTDTNVELAVSQLPKDILPAATPSALLDLPNELFDLILAHLPTSDLLNLTQQFHLRLRAVSARAYLKRIDVLHNHNIIYLTRDVPVIAFQLLSAVRLFDHISLVCDLYYFVEYGRELRDLALTKARVRSLRINFHPNEKALLNDPRTSASLVAFLTIVQESCHTLSFERQLRDPSYQRLTNAATCSTRQLRPLPARFILTGLSSLTISAFILRVSNLATACRALLQSPEVDTFQLDDCRSQRECDGVLAMSTFPVLKAITIRTVHNTAIYLKPAFFVRHSEIDSVSLYAYAIYGRSTPTAAPRSLFPLPRLSHLNLTTNHYFRRLESSSRLRRCFLQTPNSFIQHESVEYCSNMNSLFTFVSSLAQHHFEGLELAIQLPNSILYHAAHFQHSGNVCSCITPTGHQLLGVEKLEVEVDSFNTVVAVSFSLLPFVRRI